MTCGGLASAATCVLLAVLGVPAVEAQGAATPEPETAGERSADAPEPTLEARAVVSVSRGVGSAAVSAEAARTSAGTAGEPVRALVNLPGVSQAAFDSGEVVLWGSDGRDSRVYLDGIELPALFHPSGIRTTIHPALLERFVLTAGAPGPELGRALGGAIELDSRKLLVPGYDVQLVADVIDVSIAARHSFGPLRGLWAVRSGHLDRLQRWLAAETREVVSVPAYADGVVKAELELGERALLTATWLASHDRDSLGGSLAGAAAERVRARSRDFQIASLRLERSFADGAQVVVSPFVGTHSQIELSRFAIVPALLDQAELRYGARASYERRVGSTLLRLGFDGMAVRTQVQRSGSLTLPAREGDVAIFGQPPGDEVNADRYSTYDVNVAPYASARQQLGPVTITPGLRLEIHALNTSRRLPRSAGAPAVGVSELYVEPEPRLQARIELLPWLVFGARGGIHHQPPPAEDRSAVFGNPKLEPARSDVVAAGPIMTLRDVASVEITGFYRKLRRLAVRTAESPPRLAEALVPSGTGQVFGAQIALIQPPWNGLSSALAYTLSRSERTEPSRGTRRFDHDQPHVLTASVGYRLAWFSCNARARVAGGRPRADIEGAYYDIRDGRYEPLLGNADARLPTFFSLDARIEATFGELDSGWAVYLEALTVTNRRNIEEIAYSYDYSSREDIAGLPALATLGLRVTL